MPRLTEIAHRMLKEVLKPGDLAIDATAGHGHDTRFLAECVGPSGWVYAFEIQPTAYDSLRKELPDNVKLIEAGHETMGASVEYQAGDYAAIMFNLGYLPGGDKAICTQPATTLAAIRAGLELLDAGGVMTVLAYRGHSIGQIETDLLEKHFKEMPGDFQVERHDSEPGARPGPVLWAIRKG